MAAIAVTAAQVVASTDPSRLTRAVGGEDLATGDFAYRDSSTGQYLKADADTLVASQATHVVVGENAAAGQPIVLQDLDGDVTLGAGAAMTVGVPLFVHTTAGKVGPIGDLATGDFVTYVGTPISASVLRCGVHPSLVAVP